MALTDKLAFCTLSDLKSDLGITDSASDTALERRILVASQMLQDYLGRPLQRAAARVEKLAGFGTCRLLPALTPIVSVTSIVFDDGSTIDASTYSIETDARGEGWAIFTTLGWEWTAPGVIVASGLQAIPGQERKAFTVTFVGGYVLPNDTLQTPAPFLPPAITEACLQLAATLWKARGRDAQVAAETVGEASITFRSAVDSFDTFGIPAHIAAMVDGYKRAA